MTTLVTAAEIAQVRRKVAEPAVTTYSDALITTYIEKYPHLDEYGELPFDEYGVANSEWTPTYDLNAPSTDIWEEKAAGISSKFDFSADGGNFHMSQQYEQYMKNARYYRARRLPSSSRLVKYPREAAYDESYIGNLPEDD